jgi:hypothetical protein
MPLALRQREPDHGQIFAGPILSTYAWFKAKFARFVLTLSCSVHGAACLHDERDAIGVLQHGGVL